MNITSYGIYYAISVCILSVVLIAKRGRGQNLILIIISLELFLLSIGVILVHLSFILDDKIGSLITLYLLPLAGTESAIILSILIAYYPKRGTLTIR